MKEFARCRILVKSDGPSIYAATRKIAIAILKSGYIALIGPAKHSLEQCIDLLGFSAPEKM